MSNNGQRFSIVNQVCDYARFLYACHAMGHNPAHESFYRQAAHLFARYQRSEDPLFAGRAANVSTTTKKKETVGGSGKTGGTGGGRRNKLGVAESKAEQNEQPKIPATTKSRVTPRATRGATPSIAPGGGKRM